MRHGPQWAATGPSGVLLCPAVRLSQAGWPLKGLCCMQDCGSAPQDEPTSLCPANSRVPLPTGQVSNANSSCTGKMQDWSAPSIRQAPYLGRPAVRHYPVHLLCWADAGVNLTSSRNIDLEGDGKRLANFVKFTGRQTLTKYIDYVLSLCHVDCPTIMTRR